MKIIIQVPTIACEVCGQTITKAIQDQDQNAVVAVDMATKTVVVDTHLTEAALKQAITQAGHTPT
ncbi:MAG: heavy-metal-associated domain-containing protein [Synechococcus sp.]|nr:heavy-metal-associated domain-containing protein [Synechococcus sp.]